MASAKAETKATERAAEESRTTEQVFAILSSPIPPDEIHKRPDTGGRDIRYIKLPTVKRRLDEAVGPGNWWAETEMSDRWVKCRLTLRLPDGSTISRDGIGGYPVMPKDEDVVKGGATDAFKRAGVLFGVGIDLYEDLVPDHQSAPARPSHPSPSRGAWGNGPTARPNGQGQGQAQGGGAREYGPPRNGRALFAWAREHGYVDQVNEIGKSIGARGKMIDWPAETVAAAYATATGQGRDGDPGEAQDDEEIPY